MNQILFVVGTRPEIIKTAPVIALLRRDRRFRVKVCFTGQHHFMVDQMLRDFAVPVDFNLRIMRPGQSLAGIAARTIAGLDAVFRRLRPDLLAVQGDTTSAAAAALAASYAGVPVAHIEAGLRTFDRFQPFPEEINRVLISHLAALHFAPTPAARDNLIREGIAPRAVTVTGNTVVDALVAMRSKGLPFINPRLRRLPKERKVVLVTVHRRESFGKPLREICAAIEAIARAHPQVLLVYPVHLNPNVRIPARRTLSGVPNILLLPPLHYRDLVGLIAASFLILTDSGGIQEEAPSFDKPVLVLRGKTERPEGVRMGIARLVGSDRKKIVAAAGAALSSATAYRAMLLGKRTNPYGDGKAAERIVRVLNGYLRQFHM